MRRWTLAKWKEPDKDDPEHMAIRAINRIDGVHVVNGLSMPKMSHRIEQYHRDPMGGGTWKRIPVYHEGQDGTLTEIPQ